MSESVYHGCVLCGARRLRCDAGDPCTRCQTDGYHQCSYVWNVSDDVLQLFPAGNLNASIRLEMNAAQSARGGFGRIYKTTTSEGQVVAVKVLFENMCLPERALELSVREAWTWSQLPPHPNIVPFLGVANYSVICAGALPQLCLVSAWMDQGNVRQFVAQNPSFDKMVLLLDIAKGLQHLHSQPSPIIHGDIRGDNVLVESRPDGTMTARLADFGLAQIVESVEEERLTTTTTASMGNIRWLAFERVVPILYGLESVRSAKGTASDVFELMRTFFEILTGHVPFHNLPNDIAVVNRVHTGNNPEILSGGPDQAPPQCAFLAAAHCTLAAKAAGRVILSPHPELGAEHLAGLSFPLCSLSHPSCHLWRISRGDKDGNNVIGMHLTEKFYVRGCRVAGWQAPSWIDLYYLSRGGGPFTSDTMRNRAESQRLERPVMQALHEQQAARFTSSSAEGNYSSHRLESLGGKPQCGKPTSLFQKGRITATAESV